MEFARALRALWRRRWLVALGALIAAAAATLSVFQVGIVPPSLTSRTNEFGTASTQIMVDTPKSSFANLAEEVTPLNYRASVFARFLASPAAISLVARESGLPADAIEGQGPYEQGQPLYVIEPTAEKRSSQIIGERSLYRLRFENNPNTPLITVYAQAPNGAEAMQLANAVPAALHSYVHSIQVNQDTPPRRRVTIRQLGSATGGTVNSGVNVQIAALVFFVVLLFWCLLLIPAHTIAKGWRAAAEKEDRGPRGPKGPNGNGNGNGGGDDAEFRHSLRPYLERNSF
jgi:capsular polysaccharide biosynthesis protein